MMDPFPGFDYRQQRLLPDHKLSFSVPSRPKEARMAPVVWRWWATLTGPQADAFGTGIAAQEKLRRARLISAILVLAILAVGLLIPSALSFPLLWTPVFILAVGSLMIALLNRTGYTSASAAMYVMLIDGAIAGFLVLKPMLNAGNLSDFDLFILAVLVGSMILPRMLIPVTGIVQITLIVSIFALRPHDASLAQLIRSEGGHSYSALAGLLVLQAVGTGIAWLHAWSVERALLRASQAEELAEARAALSRQARLIAEQNIRLEEGIAQILETHRQIAAGNMAARVPMQEDHELWQIGHSLNTLLKRFQQQIQEERSLRSTQQEVEQVVAVLLEARRGRLLPIPHCHTPLGLRLRIALGV